MSRRRRHGGGKKKKTSKLGSLLQNRRKPNSRWICLGDIIDNIKERFYCWSNNVPSGSRLHWRKGKVVGHSTRAPRSW